MTRNGTFSYDRRAFGTSGSTSPRRLTISLTMTSPRRRVEDLVASDSSFCDLVAHYGVLVGPRRDTDSTTPPGDQEHERRRTTITEEGQGTPVTGMMPMHIPMFSNTRRRRR